MRRRLGLLAVVAVLVVGCGSNLFEKRSYEGERAARAVAEDEGISPAVGRDIKVKGEGSVILVTEKALRIKTVDAQTEEEAKSWLKRQNPWSLILYAVGIILFIGLISFGYRWAKTQGLTSGMDAVIKVIRHRLESADGLLKSELSSLVNDAESERATKGK